MFLIRTYILESSAHMAAARQCTRAQRQPLLADIRNRLETLAVGASEVIERVVFAGDHLALNLGNPGNVLDDCSNPVVPVIDAMIIQYRNG